MEFSKTNVEEHYSQIAPQFLDAVFLQITGLLPIFTSERLCLNKVLLYTQSSPTVSQITQLVATCSSSCFFLVPPTFPSLLLPLCQLKLVRKW